MVHIDLETHAQTAQSDLSSIGDKMVRSGSTSSECFRANMSGVTF
jgi:hypothetical protein